MNSLGVRTEILLDIDCETRNLGINSGEVCVYVIWLVEGFSKHKFIWGTHHRLLFVWMTWWCSRMYRISDASI